MCNAPLIIVGQYHLYPVDGITELKVSRCESIMTGRWFFCHIFSYSAFSLMSCYTLFISPGPWVCPLPVSLKTTFFFNFRVLRNISNSSLLTVKQYVSAPIRVRPAASCYTHSSCIKHMAKTTFPVWGLPSVFISRQTDTNWVSEQVCWWGAGCLTEGKRREQIAALRHVSVWKSSLSLLVVNLSLMFSLSI